MILLPRFLLYLTLTVFGNDAFGIQNTIHLRSSHHMTLGEVLQKYTDTWMKIPGVIGIGEGEWHGKPCLKVFIKHNSKIIKKKIPKVAG